MPMKDTLLALVGLHLRNTTTPTPEPAIPTRADVAAEISTPEALRLASVYRAISIISTSMMQLPLTVERAGQRIPTDQLPALIRRPSLTVTRADFIEAFTLSLAVTGNAYLKATKHNGEVIALDVLNPHLCYPTTDPKTGVKTISYEGKTYTTDTIRHVPLLLPPGETLGLGPIQAARAELTGTRNVRDFAAKWFTDTGQPGAILSTDQAATPEESRIIRNAWNYRDPDGNPLPAEDNPSRVRVLSKGMKYQPILISPEDAQWLESQQFNTTQVARLFGVPASLMLAAVEGNSQTYSNVEQEWISFTRFTLAAYIRKIEDALSTFTVRGQDVRFNIEGLLRTDTTTRYSAHKIALEMGLYSVEYARRIEGIPDSAAPTPKVTL